MSDKLQQAMDLIKSGERQKSKRILVEILEADPKNEKAWLWLSGIVNGDEECRYCLNQVLAINPNNTQAKKGLAWLEQKGEKVRSVEAPEQTTPFQSEEKPSTNTLSPAVSKSGVGVTTETKAPFLKQKLVWILGGIVACVIVCVAIYLMFAAVFNAIQPFAVDTSKIAQVEPGQPTATPPGEEIPDPNYLQGKSAYVAKDYEQVLRSMARVLEVNPNLAPPHWYRGMAYFYLNDYSAGLDEMEKALAIDPNYALGYADRGLMYSALGYNNRAAADWQKALTLDPTLAKVYHNIASNYHNVGNYSRAVDTYKTALAIDPKRAVTWNDLSGTQMTMGKYQDCINSASKAINLQSDLWESYYFRGTCQAELLQNEFAIVDLNTYLKHITDDPDGWYNRDLTNRRLGNIQNALSDYTRAIELDPEYTWALINRGIVYEGLEDYKKAFDDYDAALALGDIPRAYLGRGNVYQAWERYDEAVSDYQKAINYIPNYGDAYAHLVGAYVGQGEYQKALDAAAKALEYDSGQNKSLILESRSRAYSGLGDHARAQADLNKAMEQQPSVMDYFYLGYNYMATGEKQKAIQYFEYFILQGGDGNEAEIEIAKAMLAELSK
ncbi:MAG: tetratricopeptide repeat protein [Anaerolineales bacterium]|nr:tetratricopeptide repeat protein [Anaerolineales bacterium]